MNETPDYCVDGLHCGRTGRHVSLRAWRAQCGRLPDCRADGSQRGDSYRLAFVTSGGRDAQSTDIADYNMFVSTAANNVPELAALDTRWFEIASTDSVDARDNTGTAPPGDVPVFLLNDTMLAFSYGDLWDWSMAVPWDVTELGATATGSNVVWTGTGGFGTAEEALGTSDPTNGIPGGHHRSSVGSIRSYRFDDEPSLLREFRCSHRPGCADEEQHLGQHQGALPVTRHGPAARVGPTRHWP